MQQTKITIAVRTINILKLAFMEINESPPFHGVTEYLIHSPEKLATFDPSSASALIARKSVLPVPNTGIASTWIK
jgi:hypothetical protein